MSAPAGSYPSMGPRNVVNQSHTINPDVKQPYYEGTTMTAGAPQSPIQAASEETRLGPTNNVNTGNPYDKNQTTTNAKGYDTPAQATAGGDETTTCGGATGKSVQGAFRGIHGAGEMVRGNMMSAFDRALGHDESAAKNTAIAEAGKQEMRSGFAACTRPRQKSQ